ncbi:MAG: hypothetical protein AYP45_13935 [Candidatus Brocadia carolinensis]|uniref:Uncharacterized protein n=1 Tax=Candidatus Brocadia carolinensis TaxID=1004156 RepID=A0A1V4AR12_9BACT|nr:MAG: hypothetical protein AYP45_13935 [Candidatus Brocadia caroliniensis]
MPEFRARQWIPLFQVYEVNCVHVVPLILATGRLYPSEILILFDSKESKAIMIVIGSKYRNFL